MTLNVRDDKRRGWGAQDSLPWGSGSGAWVNIGYTPRAKELG